MKKILPSCHRPFGHNTLKTLSHLLNLNEVKISKNIDNFEVNIFNLKDFRILWFLFNKTYKLL